MMKCKSKQYKIIHRRGVGGVYIEDDNYVDNKVKENEDDDYDDDVDVDNVIREGERFIVYFLKIGLGNFSFTGLHSYLVKEQNMLGG